MKRPSEKRVNQELKKITEALSSYHPQKIVLFGSFARGDYHGLSDLDVIIIKETRKKFLDRIREVLELCDTEIPLEPLVYTPAEIEQLLAEGNSFIREALREGRILYDEAQERS